VPFVVLVDRVMVGLVLVDQTIPRVVIDELPSDVILPPEVAEVVEIAVMAVVVRVGIETIELLSLRHRTEAPNDLL
jgi:hypothetical protein